ncbi:hypothetical protein F5146DRAFT_1019548 [Armillaria mellea]|nr:hypothetical protein F5146DRAFT_1019548 [Armillaria mellea]
MVLRPAIGSLSRVELYTARLADPDTKKEEQKSLFGKVFTKQYSPSAIQQHNRLKAAWKECAQAQAPGNMYQLPEEITPQSLMPPMAGFIKFTQYLALATQGRLGPFAVKRTIKTLIASLFGIWRRDALQVVHPVIRQQVYAYIGSEDLQRIAPLETKERDKHFLSARDFDIMASGIFQDVNGFRTSRMMIQVLHALLLQSLSSERPGAIVESTSRRGSNEALLWRDYEFHVIPNPADPHSPLIIIRLRIHLLKGYCKDDAKHKDLLLFPETESRIFCPVSSAVAMAIEDNVFPDIKTVEEIFHPKIPPTDHHILRMYPEATARPILRSEIFDGLIWVISPTRALTYGALASHLRRVSLSKGFINHVTCYCCRRGASNRISREMTVQDRSTLMGHVEGSNKFENHYKTRLIDIDLGAVFQGRDQNVQYVEAAKALSDMSARRDENAPLELTAEAKVALAAEPELVAMDTERKKVASQIQSASKQLACVNVGEESKSEIQAQIALLTLEKKKLDLKYGRAFRREADKRVVELRAAHFDGQSTRQLTGQVHHALSPFRIFVHSRRV